jgi:hypothetical protein
MRILIVEDEELDFKPLVENVEALAQPASV